MNEVVIDMNTLPSTPQNPLGRYSHKGFYSSMRLRRWAIGAAIATAATAAALTPQSFAYADQQQAPESQPAIVQQADQTYANPATTTPAPGTAPEATAPQSGTAAGSTTPADASLNGPASEPASEPAQTPNQTDGIQTPGASDTTSDNASGGDTDSGLASETSGVNSSATRDVTTDAIGPAGNEPIENELLRDIPMPASEPAPSEHYADPKNLVDPAAAPQITIQGRTGTYATLDDAIAAARAGDTIVVPGEIRDVNGLTIDKSLTFIASENGAHIIFANQHGMLVTNGATLTLGDMSSNQIAMIATHEDRSIRNQEDRYIVKVTDGRLVLNDSAFLRLAIDGPDITTPMGAINGKAVKLDGPNAHGTINGGTVQSFNVYRCTATSNIALNVSNGASIDTISGGEFVSYQESLEVFANSSIGTISGGTFKSLQHFTGGEQWFTSQRIP